MPTLRRSNATASTATSSSLPSIRIRPTPHASPQWSPCAARKSSGGAPCWPILRRLIGRICAAIPTARTSGMRAGAWPCSPPPPSRRPISRITISAYRPRRPTNSAIFSNLYSCSSDRASRHHRRRRCSFCRRVHANSQSSRHHRRRANASVCRFRPRPWHPHS